ncbi:vWA domain-containing protein [Spirosoma gilvum]
MKLSYYPLYGWLLAALLTACSHPPVDPMSTDPIETLPEKPVDFQFFNLVATTTKRNVVGLTWKAQSGTPTYQIQRATLTSAADDVANLTFQPIGETKETTFEDKKVAPKSFYCYRVEALYSASKVIESETTIGITTSEPSAYEQALEAYTNLGDDTGGKRYDIPNPTFLPQTVIKIIKDNVGNQNVDIVLLLDNTGSMGPYIDACRKGLNQIIDALPPSARLGAGGYRDHGDLYVLRYQDLTTDFTSVRSFLSTMTASGGGDLREAVYDAVYGVLDQAKWVNKKRIIIVVGDEAPHEEPDKTDHSYQQVVDKCRQAGVEVNLFPILINESLDQNAEGGN